MRNCAFLCTPNNSKVNNALHLLPNPIVAQFILVSVNALAFSVLPQSKFPLLTMAPAPSQAAHRFSTILSHFLRARLSVMMQYKYRCQKGAWTPSCAAFLTLVPSAPGKWSTGTPWSMRGWLVDTASWKNTSSLLPDRRLSKPSWKAKCPPQELSQKVCCSPDRPKKFRVCSDRRVRITDKCSAFVADGLQATKLIFRHLWGEVRFPHSLIGTLAKPWSVPLNNPLKFP